MPSTSPMSRIRRLIARGISRRGRRITVALVMALLGAFAFGVWSIELGRELEDG